MLKTKLPFVSTTGSKPGNVDPFATQLPGKQSLAQNILLDSARIKAMVKIMKAALPDIRTEYRCKPNAVFKNLYLALENLEKPGMAGKSLVAIAKAAIILDMVLSDGDSYLRYKAENDMKEIAVQIQAKSDAIGEIAIGIVFAKTSADEASHKSLREEINIMTTPANPMDYTEMMFKSGLFTKKEIAIVNDALSALSYNISALKHLNNMV